MKFPTNKMKATARQEKLSPRSTKKLLWIFTDELLKTIDAATWLDTSQELNGLGWDVTIATSDEGNQTINGVSLVGLGIVNIYLLRQIFFHAKIAAMIWRSWQQLEVVLFHPLSAPFLLLLYLWRRIQRRAYPLFVMDTRTVPMFATKDATLKERILTGYYYWVYRVASTWFDGQTAITRRLAQSIGIPDDVLLGVWSSGVSLDAFEASRAGHDKHTVENKASDSTNPVTLVYIGTIAAERHIDVLCRSVIKANELGLAFRYVIVGGGMDTALIEKYARDYPAFIDLRGRIPHDEIPDLLATCDVGTLPFPDTEMFRVSSPIKLFEYMAAGLPILATEIVCHTDVVEDGNYLFWAEDSTEESFLITLQEIWSKRSQLAKMGTGAYTDSHRWTWAEAAKRLDMSLRLPLATERLP